MFKIVFSITAFWATWIAPCIVYADRVSVELLADDNYAPYSFREGHDAKGIYVEILKDAFSHIPEYELVIRPVPWKRGLLMVRQGEAVGIIPPYFSPNKRPYIHPYSEPILFESVAVYCNKVVLNVDRPLWPGHYYGLRIANNRGFVTPGPAFFEAVEAGNISLKNVTNANSGLKMVIQGRADCYVNDAQAIRWELKRLQESGAYSSLTSDITIGVTVGGEWGHIGFTNHDKGRFTFKHDLLQRVNRVIREMKESGEIVNIMNRFLAGP